MKIDMLFRIIIILAGMTILSLLFNSKIAVIWLVIIVIAVVLMGKKMVER